MGATPSVPLNNANLLYIQAHHLVCFNDLVGDVPAARMFEHTGEDVEISHKISQTIPKYPIIVNHIYMIYYDISILPLQVAGLLALFRQGHQHGLSKLIVLLELTQIEAEATYTLQKVTIFHG